MSSRVAVTSSSATTIRNALPNINHRRPKSDTAAKKRVTNKVDKDSKHKNADNDLTLQILEKAQESLPSQVFEISLSSQKLTSIPDINQFCKVRILDLSCNVITRIDGLHNLNELKELKLYSNKIEKIQGLEKTKELHSLHLQHNRIQSIGKGLQHVRKLKTLRLDSNLLSSIEHREIGGCAELAVLDISNNALTNISAINCLSALEELDVSANKLTNLPDISRCRHLQELDLSRNNICDLSGLKGLVCLMTLHIANNQLTSLSSIGKQRKLQELYVQHNELSSLMNTAQQFPSLEVLNISHNAIGSWEEFGNLKQTNMVELYVKGNPCISPDNIGYHHLLHEDIPSLELVDGVSLKRPTSSSDRSKPLMRPMTASHALSSRQVEEQLKATVIEQNLFEESISRRFDIMKSIFDSLPREVPKALPNGEDEEESGPESTSQSRAVSRCSNRSRIAEAQQFASEHFHPGQDEIS